MFVWVPRLTKERHTYCDVHHYASIPVAENPVKAEQASIAHTHQAKALSWMVLFLTLILPSSILTAKYTAELVHTHLPASVIFTYAIAPLNTLL